jgi:hypothetical protein
MDGVILAAGMIASLIAIVGLLFGAEGSKGIEEEPYYGRKTGKLYTAGKNREHHIV